MRHVRIENQGKLSEHSNPRFSLYLSAMLTHGAVLVHHRQVTHAIGNSYLLEASINGFMSPCLLQIFCVSSLPTDFPAAKD